MFLSKNYSEYVQKAEKTVKNQGLRLKFLLFFLWGQAYNEKVKIIWAVCRHRGSAANNRYHKGGINK